MQRRETYFLCVSHHIKPVIRRLWVLLGRPGAFALGGGNHPTMPSYVDTWDTVLEWFLCRVTAYPRDGNCRMARILSQNRAQDWDRVHMSTRLSGTTHPRVDTQGRRMIGFSLSLLCKYILRRHHIIHRLRLDRNDNHHMQESKQSLCKMW